MIKKHYYNFNKNNILNYIKNKFNLGVTSYLLIENIFNYLIKQNDYTLESHTVEYIKNNVLHSEIFYTYKNLFDFIEILNNSDIDISLLDLITNNILIEVKKL